MKRRKKASNWDLPPAEGAAAAGPAVAPVVPHMLSQTLNQQVRQSRKLYVGNVPPPSLNEESLRVFFNQAMAAANPSSDGGDAVVSVYINNEKKFSFVEFRTAEEASAAMSLDGIVFNGQNLKVRRPSDYNPSLLGAVAGSPGPALDLAKLGVVSSQVQDGPNKLFCGGLPYTLSEAEVKELLSAFGPLRSFHMVKDKDSAVSKGYCFFEYLDPSNTDGAIEGLDNMAIGQKTLTVRRAQAHDNTNANQMGGSVAFNPLAMMAMGNPLFASLSQGAAAVPATRVLVLNHMVTQAELQDTAEYDDIKAEVYSECSKYGTVRLVNIPRPSSGGPVPGLGKVFVEFDSPQESARARQEIEGRQFDGRTVIASYLSEERFAANQLD